MAAPKRELFKSADVCEMAQLQPYVLRSWEAEFPALGQAAAGGGRVYARADVELVLRIKHLVFGEGLTLAGARRRLEEDAGGNAAMVAVDVDAVLGDVARTRLREVRKGLQSILELLDRDVPAAPLPELQLVPPATGRRRKGTGK
ncbi:MAG: MerR family transcriptional regulator [Acidobacteriota bacterium]